MTREAVLDSFFNSFTIPAFVNTNVPDERDRPKAYITYEIGGGFFGDNPRTLAMNIWFRTTSEKKINNIVREVEQLLPRGGRVLRHDDGAIWLKRGDPWCQALTDEDPEIKRRYLIIDIEDWR